MHPTVKAIAMRILVRALHHIQYIAAARVTLTPVPASWLAKLIAKAIATPIPAHASHHTHPTVAARATPMRLPARVQDQPTVKTSFTQTRKHVPV
ncbi:hypothetical protein [Nitrosomonas sp. Is37]|uniref:hypothetical protein n=1 Tax=Nitrosomonas sp. Is37 TaxID=3080535 RepID=UPI00294B40C0|nr:hypothetical protein [Nitrosomonas sp. Is37]MDV6343792.1 hypothetical protein [Nitrosomonas sp. Is37]